MQSTNINPPVRVQYYSQSFNYYKSLIQKVGSRLQPSKTSQRRKKSGCGLGLPWGKLEVGGHYFLPSKKMRYTKGVLNEL